MTLLRQSDKVRPKPPPCRGWMRILAAAIVPTLLFAVPCREAQGQEKDSNRVVQLEIAVANMQAGDHQQWAERLSTVGADNVRLKGSGRAAEPSVSEESFGGRVHIVVRGVLRGDNQLALPGGVFGIEDLDGIRELIRKYRGDGAQATLAEKVAFGLTPEQLVELSERLATGVDFPTRDQPLSATVDKMAAVTGVHLEIGSAERQALAESGAVLDELQGLAAGTALAAALRPAGLVLVPMRPVGGETKLVLRRSDAAREFWPVGWPPQTSPLEAAPTMYERLAVQINDTPLLEALAAIQSRTGVPQLFDHNALALKRIDLAQRKVTLNQPKDTYFALVRELLRLEKPKLRLEIRQDEALKPFVWISPQ